MDGQRDFWLVVGKSICSGQQKIFKFREPFLLLLKTLFSSGHGEKKLTVSVGSKQSLFSLEDRLSADDAVVKGSSKSQNSIVFHLPLLYLAVQTILCAMFLRNPTWLHNLGIILSNLQRHLAVECFKMSFFNVWSS